MESRQRHELKLVTHLAEFSLEIRNGGIVQLLFPIERWRAVVRQQLAWEFRANRIGEFLRLRQVRSGSFAPKHVGIRRVSQPASNSRIDPATKLIKAFRRAFAINELAIALVRVRKQESRRVCIRARNENRRHAANIRS